MSEAHVSFQNTHFWEFHTLEFDHFSPSSTLPDLSHTSLPIQWYVIKNFPVQLVIAIYSSVVCGYLLENVLLTWGHTIKNLTLLSWHLLISITPHLVVRLCAYLTSLWEEQILIILRNLDCSPKYLIIVTWPEGPQD